MKKIIALMLTTVLLLGSVTASFAGTELRIPENMIQMQDGSYLTEDEFIKYLYDHDNEIVNVGSTNTFMDSIDSYAPRSYNNYAMRSGMGDLTYGTWNVPGIGLVYITALAITLEGGRQIKAGSRIFKKIIRYFANKKTKEQLAADIPDRLKSGETQVDLDKFDQKVKGKVKYKNKKTGWTIESTDGNTHGGGVQWKLRDSDGDRVATIDGEGHILRK